jgi:hypothetical protein
MSYFPNWQVDGAEGPWRIGPNMMVVVPTSTHVRLHYERSRTDYVAYLLTLVGIGLLVVFRVRGNVRHRGESPFDREPFDREPVGTQVPVLATGGGSFAGAGAPDDGAYWRPPPPAAPPPDTTGEIPFGHVDVAAPHDVWRVGGSADEPDPPTESAPAWSSADPRWSSTRSGEAPFPARDGLDR